MIHRGDLFDVLPTLEAESVDACVTDPPYDLTQNKRGGSGAASVNLDSPYGRARIGTGNGAGGFMGKAWDGTGVAFKVETWREVYRVLKPGAYVAAFGGTRTFHRMTCAIEDAGFEIRDCLSWLYGQGFPKSLNLGDGKGTALKPAHEPIALAWKPFKGSIKACHAQHGTAALNINDCRIEGIKPVMERTATIVAAKSMAGESTGARSTGEMTDVGRWPANVLLDEDAAALLDAQTGELISGANPTRRSSDKFRDAYGEFKGQEVCVPARGLDAGGASRFYKVCSSDCALCGTSCVKRDTMSACESTSASSAASRSRAIRQIIDATALNPALASLAERLVLAAPSAESLCERCVTCIALALAEIKSSGSQQQALRAFPVSIPRSKSSILIPSLASFAALWANTDIIPTTQSLSMLFGSVCHAIESSTRQASHANDSGQTRFLYSAKPSREERDMGCYDLPARSGGDATDRSEGSAGLNNPRAGAGRTGGARNIHPTVKPVELMRWLVRLVTPPGGLVLDPFTGSGTTGMACRYEQRRFIGIEREAEYVEIAERRIAAVAPLFGEATA